MAHLDKSKSPLLNRVRRIQGQLASIHATIEAGSECSAVLQQVAAVRGAISGLMNELLAEQIREHVGATDISDRERAAAVDELLPLLRSFVR